MLQIFPRPCRRIDLRLDSKKNTASPLTMVILFLISNIHIYIYILISLFKLFSIPIIFSVCHFYLIFCWLIHHGLKVGETKEFIWNLLLTLCQMEAMFYISLGYPDRLTLFSNKNKLMVIWNKGYSIEKLLEIASVLVEPC